MGGDRRVDGQTGGEAGRQAEEPTGRPTHSPISTSLCSPPVGALHQLAKVWTATKLGWNSQLGLVRTPLSLEINSVGRS